MQRKPASLPDETSNLSSGGSLRAALVQSLRLHSKGFCHSASRTAAGRYSAKPEQIRQKTDGNVMICEVKGKGGKVRDIDVLRGKEEAVLKFAGNPAGRPVFSYVPSHMDVHGCRREYANAMYHRYQEKLRKTEGRDFRN